MTSREDCSQLLDVNLIRSSSLSHSYEDKLMVLFLQKTVFVSSLLPLPLCPGYSWLRTPFLFVTVPDP